jgi:hypothetical protein
MLILLGCEESQAVCIEFRKLGHEAYSCDLQPCSGGHPEWHLQMDIFEAIELKKWDIGIFFPTCTYLTVTANKWIKEQPLRKSGVLVGEARREARREAIDFFMRLWNCDIPRISMENPIGCMSSVFQKPNQIIQPYYFGDKSRKSTCLWLKNLPKLVYSKENNLFEKQTIVEPDIYVFKNGNGTCSRDYMYALKQGKDRAKIRSKTFPGIARAMAEQWSEYILAQQRIQF